MNPVRYLVLSVIVCVTNKGWLKTRISTFGVGLHFFISFISSCHVVHFNFLRATSPSTKVTHPSENADIFSYKIYLEPLKVETSN